jgi:hypothetical protein
MPRPSGAGKRPICDSTNEINGLRHIITAARAWRARWHAPCCIDDSDTGIG